MRFGKNDSSRINSTDECPVVGRNVQLAELRQGPHGCMGVAPSQACSNDFTLGLNGSTSVPVHRLVIAPCRYPSVIPKHYYVTCESCSKMTLLAYKEYVLRTRMLKPGGDGQKKADFATM